MAEPAVTGIEADTGDKVDQVVGDWKRERPDLNTLLPMAIFGRLSRIGAIQRAIFNARHAAAGLSLGSFDVLANLRRSGEDSQKTPKELAESSLLSSGGISLRLDRMEEDGLVQRVRLTDDRRTVGVSLSEKGRALIDAVYGHHVSAQATLLSDLTVAELDELARLLRKVEDSIGRHADEVRKLSIGVEPAQDSEQ